MDRNTAICLTVALIVILLLGCGKKDDPGPISDGTTTLAFSMTGDTQLTVLTHLAYAYRIFYSEDLHPTIKIFGAQQQDSSTLQITFYGLLFVPGTTELGSDRNLPQSVYLTVGTVSREKTYSCAAGSVTLTAVSPRTLGTFECHSSGTGSVSLNGHFDLPYAGSPQATSTSLSFTDPDRVIPPVSTPLAFAYLNFYNRYGTGPTLTIRAVQQDDNSYTEFSLTNIPDRVGQTSIGAWGDSTHVSIVNVRSNGEYAGSYETGGAIDVTTISPRTAGTFTLSGTADITDGQFDVPYAGAP